MKMQVFLGGLALFVLAASAPLPAQSMPATAPASPAAADALDDATLKQIADIRNGMVDALNKRDIDGALKYLDPDCIVTWDNAEVSHGPAEVKAYCDRMLTGSAKLLQDMKINPVVEGRKLYGPGTLISYGTLGDEYTLNDGTHFALNSRFSSLLVKEDGAWKMKGFHACADVFDNPIQALVAKKVGTYAGLGAGVGGLIVGFVLAKLMGRRAKA